MPRLAEALDRPNLGEALVATLRDMIVDGRLPAGERLNEVQLAAILGVSRTPLREALGRLAAEDALTSSPRIGYSVRPLTVEEFRQIYPIRAILDPEALRLSGVPEPRRMARLTALNGRILEAADPEQVITLDDAWHLELVSGCPNRVLIGLIEQFMRRTRRYETALMRESRNIRAAADDHRKILAALRSRDLERACEALRRNLQSGIEPVLRWLEARGKKTARR
jgi:DNA-binding GntR family transcriptional regulator